jgi:hypothetical protein
MSSLRFVRLFLLVTLTAVITACASGPRSVSISEYEIQQRMTEQLSVPITLLKIFDISLTNPVIRLDEGTERLSGGPLTGKINISGKLQFDAARSAVVLTESKIENLNIQGMGLDDRYSELFNLLVAKLGGELLNNVPLYTLKPDDLRVGNRRYAPSQFNIVGRELKITLQPQ